MRKLQPVTRIAPSDNSQNAANDGRKSPSQEAFAAEARDLVALRRDVARRALSAGPPPAFQISLLEAEGGLDPALARIEAARTQARDAAALRPAATALPEAPASAEPAQAAPAPDSQTAAPAAADAGATTTPA